MCCFLSFTQSKNFKISGKIISEEAENPLKAATVYLEKIKDSTLVTYTITSKDGGFLLDDNTIESCLSLLVS